MEMGWDMEVGKEIANSQVTLQPQLWMLEPKALDPSSMPSTCCVREPAVSSGEQEHNICSAMTASQKPFIISNQQETVEMWYL